MSTTSISVILILIILFLIIGYTILLFVLAQNKSWIFAPYKPVPDFPHVAPMGDIIPLTPEQIARRQEIVEEALAQLNTNN
jgi:hypothetical protein